MGYPYVSTRVMARKSRLFEPEDYLKMVRMGNLSELIDYLSQSPYGEKLSVNNASLESLHAATYQNYAKELMDIYRFSSGNLRKLLYPFFMHLDFINLLTLVRGKRGNLDKKKLRSFLTPSPEINSKLFLEIYHLPLDSILMSLSTPLVKGIHPQMSHSDVENQLLFNWLRLVKNSLNSAIAPYVRKILLVHDIINLTKSSIYGTHVELFSEKANSLPREYGGLVAFVNKQFGISSSRPEILETELELYLLKAFSSIDMNPMSVSTILKYIKSKEIEGRNIRMIGAGIEGEFSEEEIRGELIYENRSGR